MVYQWCTKVILFLRRYSGHRCCHWCHMPGYKCKALQRMIYTQHRRYLAEDDPARTDPAFGPPELMPAHAARTHEEAVAAGEAAEAYQGPKTHHPSKLSSVKWWNPLTILPFWDMIRDFCPDTMHIIKDLFADHYIKLFKGMRGPKPFPLPEPVLKRKKGKITRAIRDEHEAKLVEWHELTARHALATEVPSLY